MGRTTTWSLHLVVPPGRTTIATPVASRCLWPIQLIHMGTIQLETAALVAAITRQIIGQRCRHARTNQRAHHSHTMAATGGWARRQLEQTRTCGTSTVFVCPRPVECSTAHGSPASATRARRGP